MNTLLAIPTYNRHDFLKTKRGAFKYLPYINPFLIDTALFIKDNPEERCYYANDKYKTIPLTYNYISQKIQQIINYAIENSYEHLILMEDDIHLSYRDCYGHYPTLQLPLDNDKLNQIFCYLLTYNNSHFPLTCPAQRLGANGKKYLFDVNSRTTGRLICLHLPTIKLLNIHTHPLFNEIMFKEDYLLQLLLIDKGFNTLTFNNFAIEDSGRNYRGGSSCTRTIENYNQSTFILYNNFKKYLTLREKAAKGWDSSKTLYEVTMINVPKFKISKESLPNLDIKDYVCQI